MMPAATECWVSGEDRGMDGRARKGLEFPKGGLPPELRPEPKEEDDWEGGGICGSGRRILEDCRTKCKMKRARQVEEELAGRSSIDWSPEEEPEDLELDREEHEINNAGREYLV
jgi:hypothetical protein